jgi:hypothetical protein
MEKTTSEPFVYAPLPSEEFFRYMELLPGTWDSDISIRLIHVPREPIPEYEAISYAWGDAQDRKMCLCEGRHLEITTSLYNALRQFRYSDKPRPLWADAVW